MKKEDGLKKGRLVAKRKRREEEKERRSRRKKGEGGVEENGMGGNAAGRCTFIALGHPRVVCDVESAVLLTVAEVMASVMFAPQLLLTNLHENRANIVQQLAGEQTWHWPPLLLRARVRTSFNSWGPNVALAITSATANKKGRFVSAQ